jgi:hypothetical protein
MKLHHRAAALRAAYGFFGLTLGLSAQTTINLSTQTKNMDFSGAVSTTPAKVGTVLPATCAVGQMFFLSNGAAGANLYSCTGANIWSLETGGGSGGTISATSIGRSNFISPSSGSATAYSSSPAVCPAALAAGQVYWLRPDLPNGVSGPTLNICAFGAKTIVHRDGSGLGIGELAMGVEAYPLIFDGTSFELGYESVTAGPSGCLSVTRTNSQPLFDINTACLPRLTAANTWTGANDFTVSPFLAIPAGTPSTSSAACTRGSIEYDGSFIYVCIASNTWKRAAIAAF